jgi:hypothetical protein
MPGDNVDKVSPPERLSSKQYLVLVLRLLVDLEGQVVQGEVGTVEDDQDIEHWVRFRGLDGLTGAVQVVVTKSLGHPG